MLCKNCLEELYKGLSIEDLAILFFLNGKENQIKASINHNENIERTIIIDNSLKAINNKFRNKIKNVTTLRIILYTLVKLNLIDKNKNDHTLNFKSNENGKNILLILEQDNDKKNEIIKFIKECSN